MQLHDNICLDSSAIAFVISADEASCLQSALYSGELLLNDATAKATSGTCDVCGCHDVEHMFDCV